MVWILVGIAIVLVVFVVTHLRPLSDDEITQVAKGRRGVHIEAYFRFDTDRLAVDPDFKSQMRATGRLYVAQESLCQFPSLAAGLLKYKKHEWIVVAFERNREVRAFWVNKGPDKTQVSSGLGWEEIGTIAQTEQYASVLVFHNHPNPNPAQFACHSPSEVDLRSASELWSVLSSRGVNLLEFVCERGFHHEYYRAAADPFFPIQRFQSQVSRANDVSRVDNLCLHCERLFGLGRARNVNLGQAA